jgi:NADPH-dependent 2,4-dienoyl-CoA reductase/sulfur reductase-like enzyme
MLAAELQRRHEEHGVRFHLSTGVTGFEGTDHVTGVALTDGSLLPADLVVEALGSRPAVGWLDGHGFDLTDGVLTDGALRPLATDSLPPLASGTPSPFASPSSPRDHANRTDHANQVDHAMRVDHDDRHPVDGVAVVGDIARFPNPRFGSGAWRVEHWSVPTDTGRRAGAVLAAYLSGDDDRYAEVTGALWEVLPSFWSDQYDIRLQSYGMPGLADPDGIAVLEGKLEGECVVGYSRDGQLVGVVGLGMLPRVNSYRDQLRYVPATS